MNVIIETGHDVAGEKKVAARKHGRIESHNEAASIRVSGGTANAAKRSLGGLSLRRFLQ